MLEEKTICYIEEKNQPRDFIQCSNCYLNVHTCELSYEQFICNISKYSLKYDRKYSSIKDICNCNKCTCIDSKDYCEYFLKKAYEKMKEINKVNCRVCRSENGLDKPLDYTCKCRNKKKLYFYEIIMYKEIDMNKNECYTIKIYNYEDYLKEKNKLCYAHESAIVITASINLRRNVSPIHSFTIYDTLDDSDTLMRELLEKNKSMLDHHPFIIDSFYFRKFINLYKKILEKNVVEKEQKPNVHLTRKKKIR
jgi:hypothetical protein